MTALESLLSKYSPVLAEFLEVCEKAGLIHINREALGQTVGRIQHGER
jgi:hypothetical protein